MLIVFRRWWSLIKVSWCFSKSIWLRWWLLSHAFFDFFLLLSILAHVNSILHVRLHLRIDHLWITLNLLWRVAWLFLRTEHPLYFLLQTIALFFLLHLLSIHLYLLFDSSSVLYSNLNTSSILYHTKSFLWGYLIWPKLMDFILVKLSYHFWHVNANYICHLLNNFPLEWVVYPTEENHHILLNLSCIYKISIPIVFKYPHKFTSGMVYIFLNLIVINSFEDCCILAEE